MGWTEILVLLIQNAPAIIQTVEEGIEWAGKTWTEVKAAYDQDPATITKEQLLSALARIKANSDAIQNMD